MHVVKTPGIRRTLRHPQQRLALFHCRRHVVGNDKPIRRQFQRRPLCTNRQVFRRSFTVRKVEVPGEQFRVSKPRKPGQESIRQFVSGIENRRRPGAAGILPLRLGRQAVGLAFLLREPLAELDRFVPTDPAGRFVRQALAFAILRIELPVLFDGDLGGTDEERFGDLYLMHGLLIPVRPIRLLGMFFHIIVCLRPVLAHRERAGLDGHELHADGVGDGLGGVAHGIHRRHGKDERNEEEADGFHEVNFRSSGSRHHAHAQRGERETGW